MKFENVIRNPSSFKDVVTMNSSVTKQGSVAENLHVAEDQVDHLLGSEYEHEPVPISARRTAFSVTMVWLGFPMIITGAMTGSLLVLGMGFSRALSAIISSPRLKSICRQQRAATSPRRAPVAVAISTGT